MVKKNNFFFTSRRPKRPCPLVVPTMTAAFLDENLPDGTRLRPGTKFIKYWKMRNTGTMSWNAETKVKTDPFLSWHTWSYLQREEIPAVGSLKVFGFLTAKVHVGKPGRRIWRPLERSLCSFPSAWTGETDRSRIIIIIIKQIADHECPPAPRVVRVCPGGDSECSAVCSCGRRLLHLPLAPGSFWRTVWTEGVVQHRGRPSGSSTSDGWWDTGFTVCHSTGRKEEEGKNKKYKEGYMTDIIDPMLAWFCNNSKNIY